MDLECWGPGILLSVNWAGVKGLGYSLLLGKWGIVVEEVGYTCCWGSGLLLLRKWGIVVEEVGYCC